MDTQTIGSDDRIDTMGTLGLQEAPTKAVAAVRGDAARHESEMDEQAARRADRERRVQNGMDWPTITWITLVHVGALVAPFVFTWQALVLTLVLHWFTGGIGICLGFHRLFTHNSFRTYRPVQCLIAWIGGLAGEGSCIHWVANHRKHHALSDKVGDPHSPHDGAWWSHMIWTMCHMPAEQATEFHRRWTPDLADDPMLRFLERTFILWHILMGAVIFALGFLYGGLGMACSLLVWGMFVRLAFVLHSTWFVNSASHMWGYRNYETTDDSRNNWWVALIAYGEGWHNNHHAYPRMARHGHRWWEVDMTFLAIRLLDKLGLAWDVVDNQHRK